ncbi:arylamine N-acetyltransferase [Novosphingobium panipatense]
MKGEWLLERAGPAHATDGRAQAHEDWQPQYSFDLSAVGQADLDQANHWTSTRPDTRFTTLHVASIPLPSGFASMTDLQLTIHDGAGTRSRAITDAADYTQSLREIFQISLDLEEAAALALFS